MILYIIWNILFYTELHSWNDICIFNAFDGSDFE